MDKTRRNLHVNARIVFACLISIFSFFVATAHACTTDQIDTGTECVDTKFSVTTTNLDANTTFKFAMSAKGTFYVDCDDGVAISGTGASGNTILRDNTTEAVYTCAYINPGVKTIKFAGLATEYNANAVYNNTIRFGYSVNDEASKYTPQLVSAVNGSVGQIFSRITGLSAPSFSLIFARTQITTVPGTMFNGVSGSRAYMFYGAFLRCGSLVSIPENLFGWQYRAASAMFEQFCANCTALQSIPGNLFSGVSGGNTFSFYAAFTGCTSLTSIPPELFKNVTLGGASEFRELFRNCTNLSGYIPASTFAGLIANGSPISDRMFESAFSNTKLSTTTCPRRTELVETGYEEYWGGRIACAMPPPKIVTTSYVQGFYEEIDTKKQDKLESGVNLITTGAPDGMVVSITADHGVVHVHKEEIQIPVDSVENPTGWLPIWVE